MHGMLFGLETELAFAVLPRAERRANGQEALLGEFFSLAHERLTSLPEAPGGSGMFLSNGSRLYLDCGTHPELCSPECRSPAEVVCWQLAGERLLAGLTAELEKRHPGKSVSLYRCNVDYGGTGSTWGCHESYLHRTTGPNLAAQLIPFLVTRLVYTGAGGFDNRAGPLRFLISPRVVHLQHEIGPGTSPERGIYHSKNEPLGSGGYGRLHLMCGESLSSQLSNYLKVGATALVVRLIDAGLSPGERLGLRFPLQAMAQLAADPTCSATVELLDGRWLSALDVQEAYLDAVEARLGDDYLPAWAPEVCRRWRRVLEQLQAGPGSLAASLDWTIKHALFEDHLARAGASWRGLRRESGLGAQLCEVDTRFGELGERGIFHALDRAGALDHRIPELGSVERAMRRPPAGRAGARGRAIARLFRDRAHYVCSWDRVMDVEGQRILDLGDPFVTRPRWKSRRGSWLGGSPAERARRRIDQQIGLGNAHYHQMEAEAALAAFGSAINSARRLRDAEREGLARFWSASTYQDLADLDGAERVLAPALTAEGLSLQLRCRLWTRCALVRIERGGADAAIDEAMAQAREAQRDAGACQSRLVFLEARRLAAGGQHAAAIAAMERAIRATASDRLQFGSGSHWHWLVASALELGDLERARHAIERLRALGADYYRGIRLRCDESALARAGGEPALALRHATTAVNMTDRLTSHRCRLEALLEWGASAVAASESERAAEVAEEVAGWEGVQVKELRVRSRDVQNLPLFPGS